MLPTLKDNSVSNFNPEIPMIATNVWKLNSNIILNLRNATRKSTFKLNESSYNERIRETKPKNKDGR